jgi:hypothetical protein
MPDTASYFLSPNARHRLLISYFLAGFWWWRGRKASPAALRTKQKASRNRLPFSQAVNATHVNKNQFRAGCAAGSAGGNGDQDDDDDDEDEDEEEGEDDEEGGSLDLRF